MSTKNFIARRRTFKRWDNDNGDKPSSIQILINWLTDVSNYSRWKGGDSSGKTKEVLCSEIREIMVENDITNWSNGDICSKIQYLHDKFKDVTDFLNGTGQGILNDINESCKTPEEAAKTLEEKVKQKCTYYYDLKCVMLHRPSVNPPFPMTSGDPIDVSGVYKEARSHEEVEAEDKVEFDAEVQDDKQLDKTLPVYHLSATSSGSQKPSKWARQTIDASISEIVEESVKLNHIHVELIQKKFEPEAKVNERQLRHQEIAHEDRMIMEERRLNIEAKRVENEAKQLKNDCIQSKLQYIAKLESLGLFKEYILKKLDIKL
ncbi:hypothetical protein F4703DRAFT_1975296 [Phycomyces blakesleeanus]